MEGEVFGAETERLGRATWLYGEWLTMIGGCWEDWSVIEACDTTLNSMYSNTLRQHCSDLTGVT